MKTGVGVVLVLVAIAGCAAPAAGPTVSARPTTAPSPTADPTPTASPRTAPTPTGPTQNGIGATISGLGLSDREVTATVRVTNYGQTPSQADLAFRFVENDSHALVGQTALQPGGSETFEVPLRLYGDDPAELTVQARVNGTVVAERRVASR
jgi:hypothetical protein